MWRAIPTPRATDNKKETPLYVDAWTYRDYVIDAFNSDKPYDRFIVEQIAADKLPLGQDKRPLAALGFLTLGDRFNGNPNDVINDQIDVVSKGFLGLTVSCARCHDHMFDPIPQKDYYSLHGIFASSAQPKENPIIAAQGDAKLYQDYLKARQDAMAGARQYRAGGDPAHRDHFPPARGRVSCWCPACQGPDRRKYIQSTGLPRARTCRRSCSSCSRRAPASAARAAARSSRRSSRLPSCPPISTRKRRPNLAAEIAKGTVGKLPVNPHIAAMFKGKAPASIEEVAAAITPPFSSSSTRSRRAGRAALPRPCSPAPSPPRRRMPNLQELKDAPFREAFLQELTTSEDAGKLLPQKAGNRYQQLLSAVAKVELTHPGAPKRANALEDAPKLGQLAGLHPRRGAEQGRDRAAPFSGDPLRAESRRV